MVGPFHTHIQKFRRRADINEYSNLLDGDVWWFCLRFLEASNGDLSKVGEPDLQSVQKGSRNSIGVPVATAAGFHFKVS